MCRMRNSGALHAKQEVFIKALPPERRELKKRLKDCKSQRSGWLQGNRIFQTQQDQYKHEPRDWQHIRDLHKLKKKNKQIIVIRKQNPVQSIRWVWLCFLSFYSGLYFVKILASLFNSWTFRVSLTKWLRFLPTGTANTEGSSCALAVSALDECVASRRNSCHLLSIASWVLFSCRLHFLKHKLEMWTARLPKSQPTLQQVFLCVCYMCAPF